MELLIVLAILAIMAALVYPGGPKDKARARQIQCANNLKQTGLAFRIGIGDQGWDYSVRISTNRGGTRELISGPIAFRHFQILSNEFADIPKILICPSDSDPARFPATTFNWCLRSNQIPFTSNSNLSYFVGLDASEMVPQSFLSGDRNITNGMPLKDGILELTPANPAGWTAGMHNKTGNILLADGSVQVTTTTGLPGAVTNASAVSETNRLLMPILND